MVNDMCQCDKHQSVTYCNHIQLVSVQTYKSLYRKKNVNTKKSDILYLHVDITDTFKRRSLKIIKLIVINLFSLWTVQ